MLHDAQHDPVFNAMKAIVNDDPFRTGYEATRDEIRAYWNENGFSGDADAAINAALENSHFYTQRHGGKVWIVYG